MWKRTYSLGCAQRCLQVLLFSSAALLACSQSPTSNTSIPIEVWRGGDDGFTSRFADALELAFGKDRGFALSSGKQQGTLIVTIPTNVEWTTVAGHTEVVFLVEFTTVTNESLGNSRGKCSADRLEVCAALVIKDANTARAALLHKSD
jgi:hypothetical protein